MSGGVPDDRRRWAPVNCAAVAPIVLTSAKKSAAVVLATTSSRALFAHGPSHTPRARYIERTRPPAALDTRPSPAFAFALRRRRPSSPHFSYRV